MNMTQGSAVLLIFAAIIFNGSEKNLSDTVPLLINFALFFYWWVNERTKKGKNE